MFKISSIRLNASSLPIKWMAMKSDGIAPESSAGRSTEDEGFLERLSSMNRIDTRTIIDVPNIHIAASSFVEQKLLP
jgi:hypothetical protein